MFFVLVVFANIEILHNHLLSKLIILFVVFICITFCIIAMPVININSKQKIVYGNSKSEIQKILCQ